MGLEAGRLVEESAVAREIMCCVNPRKTVGVETPGMLGLMEYLQEDRYYKGLGGRTFKIA